MKINTGEWSTLHHFIPRETSHDINCTGDTVSPTATPSIEEKRKISCPYSKSNPDSCHPPVSSITISTELSQLPTDFGKLKMILCCK